MSKYQCCILTDDVYLFNGIKSLYPDLGMLRENFAGDYLTGQCLDSITTVIIDGRLLLNGKWRGYERLLNARPEVNAIWLFHRSVCGFLKCENFLSCICLNITLPCFREKLLERIENRKHQSSPCTLLSAYEKELLPYFVDGIPFDTLAKFFACSEKTLHLHRLDITSKFGFRSTYHMSSILYRISPLLIET